MALISPVEMPDEDKLETLRRLDQFRWWRSVDEKRYCLICGKIITGQQIQAMEDTRGNGPKRVICPTKGCHSIPMGLGASNRRSPGKDRNAGIRA